jgi:hypothetical protein
VVTAHTYHADSHAAGLADGCPRCAEHAVAPWATLDRDNIYRLLHGGAITETDRTAAVKLRSALEVGRFLVGIDEGAL